MLKLSTHGYFHTSQKYEASMTDMGLFGTFFQSTSFTDLVIGPLLPLTPSVSAAAQLHRTSRLCYQTSAWPAISRICFAISSGERMKSRQPLSIALCGMSG